MYPDLLTAVPDDFWCTQGISAEESSAEVCPCLAEGVAGGTLVVAVLVGLLATVFRVFGVQRANDVFIDEVTYADIARQIADGHMPSIFGTPPFFLHPPQLIRP